MYARIRAEMEGAKRVLLVAAVASLSVTAAIAIVVLLFGDFGHTEVRILGTTFAISLYSLLALPGAILLERRQAEPLAWATIGAAVIGFALALVAVWAADDSERAWRWVGTTTAVAAALTQISALTSRRRDDDEAGLRGVYYTACALVALLATLVTIAIWKDIDDQAFYRALGALAVLDVFLVVLQPLLRRLRGPGARPTRVVLEGTPEEIDEALRRVEGSGVRVRR
jgi:hypothetical protein